MGTNGPTYRFDWIVMERYEIQPVRGVGSAVLVGHGKEKGIYQPADVPTLPTELARVNRTLRGDGLRRRVERLGRENPSVPVGPLIAKREQRIEALLSFARSFGNLGQRVIERPARTALLVVDLRDDLRWALAHAQNVDVYLWLLAKLRFGEWNLLRRAFQAQQLTGDIGRRSRRRNMVHELPILAPPWFVRYRWPELPLKAHRSDVTSATQELMAELINPNLEGVVRRYDPAVGSSVFDFTALIPLIYWQLADQSGGGIPRECKDCNTIFFAHDGRQEFCPPPPGVKQSRCGRRYRAEVKRHDARPQKTSHRKR